MHITVHYQTKILLACARKGFIMQYAGVWVFPSRFEVFTWVIKWNMLVKWIYSSATVLKMMNRIAAQIWMLPGLVVYLVERITRWIWPAVRTAQLLDVQLLGTKERVICLRVAKPVSFHYR